MAIEWHPNLFVLGHVQQSNDNEKNTQTTPASTLQSLRKRTVPFRSDLMRVILARQNHFVTPKDIQNLSTKLTLSFVHIRE
jgi:predicted metal-dependent HD superfamily phosphohydrolase